MSLELVIFDVDGLLLNTERVWQDVWRDVAESYGISEWTQESFLHVVGRTGIAVREFLNTVLQGKCSTEEFLGTARQTGLKRLESQLEVKTGVYEILDYIKMTGIRCAVATSTSRVLTEERLRKLHLIQHFDYICCGDEVKHTKPSPDVYLNVIDTMNVCKDNALVFEDSAVGVQAAWSAGIPVVMVPDLVQATEIIFPLASKCTVTGTYFFSSSMDIPPILRSSLSDARYGHPWD